MPRKSRSYLSSQTKSPTKNRTKRQKTLTNSLRYNRKQGPRHEQINLKTNLTYKQQPKHPLRFNDTGFDNSNQVTEGQEPINPTAAELVSSYESTETTHKSGQDNRDSANQNVDNNNTTDENNSTRFDTMGDTGWAEQLKATTIKMNE